MKALFESMHGQKMAVEYSVLNSGKQILLVKEDTTLTPGKPKFEQRQIVELEIKDGEGFSTNYGFRCSTKDNEFVYAVVSKKKAKQKGEFHPERSWVVDETKLRLNAVTKSESVSCIWSPEGDSRYNF